MNNEHASTNSGRTPTHTSTKCKEKTDKSPDLKYKIEEESPPKKIRKDRNGNQIIKGSKNYKVRFADTVKDTDVKLVVCYEVESYKKYNGIEEIEDTPKCNCALL